MEHKCLDTISWVIPTLRLTMETVLRFLFLATLVCSGKIIVSSVRLKSSRKWTGNEPEVDVKVVYVCSASFLSQLPVWHHSPNWALEMLARTCWDPKYTVCTQLIMHSIQFQHWLWNAKFAVVTWTLVMVKMTMVSFKSVPLGPRAVGTVILVSCTCQSIYKISALKLHSRFGWRTWYHLPWLQYRLPLLLPPRARRSNRDLPLLLLQHWGLQFRSRLSLQ